MKEDEGRCREMKFERKMRRNEGKEGEEKAETEKKKKERRG